MPVVVSSKYDGYPVYSPNGERIAFASDRSGDWQIWVCDKDGANAIQLTSVKGGEAWPTSWQPADGRRIGFVSNSDGTRRAYMVAPLVAFLIACRNCQTQPYRLLVVPNGVDCVLDHGRSLEDANERRLTHQNRRWRGQPTFDGAGG